MKQWNGIKLKDYKSDRYLLLVDDIGDFYLQEFNKDIQRTSEIRPMCSFYQGKLIIDNLPKEYFIRLFCKFDEKYYGAIDFEKQRLELIELNRAIDHFLELGFKPIDFNVEQLKRLINYRIEKTIKNIDTWINNFGYERVMCNIHRFNSLNVDMHHRDSVFKFKKDNVTLSIMNDCENRFKLFKRVIHKDKEERYDGNTIFHHKLLV
jgi:hypothetical protein